MGCPIVGAGGSPCGRPVLEDGKCVFHSGSKRDTKEFETAFLKFLSDENRSAVVSIDCTGFVFPDFAPNGKWHVAKDIVFDNATFSGKTNINMVFTGRASFEHARFLDDVDFTRCEFHELVSFNGARFDRSARFDGVRFSRETDFCEARFGMDASFNRVEFVGDSMFRESAFEGVTSFSFAVFRDEAFLPRSRFVKNCSFDRCRFSLDADFSNSEFSARTSFTGSEFVGLAKFSMAHFDGEADFVECRFGGVAAYDKVSFSDTARFGEVKCDGIIVFSEAVFTGNAEFRFAEFHSQALFYLAEFVGESDFRSVAFCMRTGFIETKFIGDTSFQWCEFRDCVDFGEAEFRRVANFGHSCFLSMADFNGTALLGSVQFDHVRFLGTAGFRGTIIGEFVSFDGAEFSGDGYFQDLVFSKSESRSGYFLDFEGVIVRNADCVRFEGRGEEPLDLSGVLFAFTDINMIRFLNVTFSGSGSSGELRWGDRLTLWLIGKMPNEFVKIQDEERVFECPPGDSVNPEIRELIALRWEHVGAIYKGLRESYERSLKYDEAGQFHIREMEARRFANGQKGKGRLGRWGKRNLSILNVYRWLSLYGESYRLVSIWIVATVFLFAMARWLQSAPLDGDILGILSDLVDSFSENLSTSILAFLQLKSETTIDLAERVTGAILVILFGMALHRNFKR